MIALSGLLISLLVAVVLILVSLLVVWYLRSYISSEPNEWMLVIRNGVLVTYGIGISFYKSWGDKVVRFPSKINRVNFTAQQVTSEKQGIEVSGVIIWTIYRDDEGPFKAYRNLGEDLVQKKPVTANETLKQMSGSIVRHRIANSTIEQILTKRDEVRNEIKNEMNKVVNGWGVWLESVEITDVRILSSSLFGNLQTEFRESQRQKAEMIKMNIQNEINEKRLDQNLELEKKRSANVSKQQIFQANETLKIQEENQKVLVKKQEIEQLKIESNAKLSNYKNKTNAEIQRNSHDIAHQTIMEQKERIKEELLKQKEIDLMKEETKLEIAKKQNENKKFKDDYNREKLRQDQEMEQKLKASTDYKILALDTIKDIYQTLNIQGLKIVNLGKDSGDPVGGLIANVLSSVKALKEE